ncbi:DUF4062 domain-containing protein [Epilithonimonas pallida]|uniref:DUF4062 domain-containing protein n=1 Tax=Epilithonimonas pallida TaxID=373671 RepID=A0ABY1R6M2_9FLAO|nr:DUF4062 domain-containing protein [Epilithonimonas pallida]SMP93294.1 protein of unknown function [Epilithonimonas pallida]
MKKYQVFVSSTYEDLKDERKEVIQALLELDCIPVGMEMFPAADEDQWSLIKDLIVDCDYYILIIGGRYGSLSKEGISYTQKEYEFAIENGIPSISFLHKTPDQIIVAKTDKDKIKTELLENFRNIVSEKMVRFWETPEQLGSIVSRSLVKLIKSRPRIGWVKSDRISSEESSLEILKLTQEIQKLKNTLNDATNKQVEDLSQADELFEISFKYKKSQNVNYKDEKIKISWNDIFTRACTVFINEAPEEAFRATLTSYIKFLLRNKISDIKNLVIITDYFITILIQFKALGLIEKSVKNRSVKDNNTYWKLTKKGDDLLTNLRAIKRTE